MVYSRTARVLAVYVVVVLFKFAVGKKNCQKDDTFCQISQENKLKII